MKRLLWFILLTGFVQAQSVTPNLSMTWPPHGSSNWDAQVVSNSNIIDNIFGIPTCGDSGHAVGWNSMTKQLTCQPIAGGVGGFPIINAGVFPSLQAALATCGTSCEIYVPAGTYSLGTPSASAGLTIARNNVTIRGAGMGRTVITYNSSGCNGTLGPGSAILVGDGANEFSNITISDLTLHDLDVSTNCFAFGGHNPSAIDTFLASNLTIERVEAQDCKGNACFTPIGAADSINLIIRDCYLHGTNAGGWIQFIGINYSNFTNVQISGNYVSGVRTSTLIGGGGTSNDVHISHNTLDGTQVGTPISLIGVNGGNRQVVEGNTMRISASEGGVLITTDDSTGPSNDTTVENNIIRGVQGSVGITYSPDPGSAHGPLRISNNEIIAGQPIVFNQSTGPVDIGGNVANLAGGSGPMISGVGVPATAIYSVHDNQVVGAGSSPQAKVIDFSTAGWKTRNLRLWNNIIGSGAMIGDQQTGAIDGGTAITLGDGVTIAPGATTASTATTVIGALLGDAVNFVPQITNTTPRGIMFSGAVTAADTVTWQATNTTNAAITTASSPNDFTAITISRGFSTSTSFGTSGNTSGSLFAGSVVFANLGTPPNGTVVYCSDCKNVTDDTTGTFDSVAASGGHGTAVLRENGAWRVH